MSHKPLLNTLAACFLALVLGACSTTPAPTGEQQIVRTRAPRNHEASVTSYFDATQKRVDPNRELVIGAPQRGTCPLGGHVGWVVPVEYKTRTKDSSTVTVTSYYFWFSEEVIRGVTRRMEVCP